MSTCACAALLLNILIPTLDGANILFFMGVGTYSHRILVWPLVERMADVGHNVTFYQPIKSKLHHPKVTEYFPDSLASLVANMEPKMEDTDFFRLRLTEGRGAIMRSLRVDIPSLGIKLCEALLSIPETQNLVQSPFDLLIIDSLFNECGYGVAHKLGARVIVLGTSTLAPWNNDVFGFPLENYWIPDLMFASGAFPPSFMDRTFTTLLEPYTKYEREVNYFPQLELILRDKLNMPEMPDIRDIERETTALILINSHFAEEFARSLPPMVVSVGGLHCPDQDFIPKPLPKEMEKFIEESGNNGFVYVSFGSAARISGAPESLQNVFYTAFRNSKTRFLWKWEGPRPKEMPDNVFTAAWMPQLDILARKPKAFIMHGGLLGTQEALTFGIPIIVMPIFAEQDYNAFRIERTGRGIMLDIASLTVVDLTGAINEILTNQTYMTNVEKTSRLFKDRPMKPVDEALWWIEYVLRNKDTSALKPLAAMELHWFQRRLLDVFAFVFIVIVTIISLLAYILKKLVIFALSLYSRKFKRSRNTNLRNNSKKVKKS